MFTDAGRHLTISVDDGHPADLCVADLLARRGLPATFYIPRRNAERPVITRVKCAIWQLNMKLEVTP